MEVKKIDVHQFENQNFNFVIGSPATYNEHFIIKVPIDNISINIGLKAVMGGLLPKAEIYNRRILLCAGKAFHICSFNGENTISYESELVFYDFHVLNNVILIIGEIELLILDNEFNLIANKKTDNVIVSYKIANDKITIEDDDNKEEIIDLVEFYKT